MPTVRIAAFNVENRTRARVRDRRFLGSLAGVEDLITKPRPQANADRETLTPRLRSYWNQFRTLIVLTASVFVLLVPVRRRVLSEATLRDGFPTIRGGLLLVVDVFLIGLAMPSVTMSFRLGKRARDVKPQIGSSRWGR